MLHKTITFETNNLTAVEKNSQVKHHRPRLWTLA